MKRELLMMTPDNSKLELLKRGNQEYNQHFPSSLARLSSSPRLQIALLCCIDTRINPLKIYGLSPGQIVILRNAGNQVTQDVIGSLIIAIHELGVSTVIVLGHTKCGTVRYLVEDALHDAEKKLGIPKQTLERLTNRNHDFDNPLLEISDPYDNVCINVLKLRTHPLFQEIKVIGQLYNVDNGKIRDIDVDKEFTPSNWIQTIVNVIHHQFKKFIKLFQVTPHEIDQSLTSSYSEAFDEIRQEFSEMIFHDTYVLTSPLQESLNTLHWDLGFEQGKILIFGEGKLSKEKKIVFNIETASPLTNIDIIKPFDGITVLGYPENTKRALLHRIDIPEQLLQLNSTCEIRIKAEKTFEISIICDASPNRIILLHNLIKKILWWLNTS